MNRKSFVNSILVVILAIITVGINRSLYLLKQENEVCV